MATKDFSGLANINASSCVAQNDEVVVNDVSTGHTDKVVAGFFSGFTTVTTIPQGNTTLTPAQAGCVLVNNSSTMTINLPAAANCPGLVYRFIKTSSAASAITIDPNASETVNGSTTNASMATQYATLAIVCDGTQWLIIP